MKVICMLLTSLVSRVTRDAVLNRSILVKENCCTFSKSASRTLAPKPRLPTVERRMKMTPKKIAARASSTIRRPIARCSRYPGSRCPHR